MLRRIAGGAPSNRQFVGCRVTLVGCCFAALLVGACAGADADSGSDGGDGLGGSGGDGPSAARVSFAVEGLVMAPGEARTLAVSIEPPGRYRFRFALLGDSLDASLDRTEVDTDRDGAASVGITAPTSAPGTSFRVRASVGAETAAELPITVGATATGTLTVVPSYAGARPVQLWVASAHTAVTCADLPGLPPADGTLQSAATAGYFPVLEVPAGRALAVTLRGEQKVSGCLELGPVAAHELVRVTVPVTDVPLKLGGVALEIELDLATFEPSWSAALAPELTTFADGLLGTSTGDLEALLDAMVEQSVTLAPDADFALARESGGWNGALISHVGTHGGEEWARDALKRWATDGLARLDVAAGLSGTLVPIPGLPGKADLNLGSFAELSAEQAGLPSTLVASWQAEPGDRLVLGVSIALAPNAIAVTLGALVEKPTATSVPDALVQVLDCAALGADLRTRALGAMGTCDAACATEVCLAAVTSLWERAVATAAASPATLELGATAAAAVNERAEPTAFTGEWIGTLTVGDAVSTGSGPIQGAASAEPPATPAE